MSTLQELATLFNNAVKMEKKLVKTQRRLETTQAQLKTAEARIRELIAENARLKAPVKHLKHPEDSEDENSEDETTIDSDDDSEGTYHNKKIQEDVIKDILRDGDAYLSIREMSRKQLISVCIDTGVKLQKGYVSFLIAGKHSSGIVGFFNDETILSVYPNQKAAMVADGWKVTSVIKLK